MTNQRTFPASDDLTPGRYDVPDGPLLQLRRFTRADGQPGRYLVFDQLDRSTGAVIDDIVGWVFGNGTMEVTDRAIMRGLTAALRAVAAAPATFRQEI